MRTQLESILLILGELDNAEAITVVNQAASIVLTEVFGEEHYKDAAELFRNKLVGAIH